VKRLRTEIRDMLRGIPIDDGGGCSVSKAYLMAYLIRRYDMRSTLDIGVYRGRSLFPQALAHSRYTGGVTYGVDPWDTSEAVEHDNPKLQEVLDRIIANTDFQAIFESVASFRSRMGFDGHCVLIRKTSSDAISFFREGDITFDLIHVDGNHDAGRVTEDLRLYLPRLRPNGFLVMDDISWDSIRPSYKRLRSSMHLLYARIDGANDYAVFRAGGSPGERAMLKATLRVVGRK
jgi:Methyltransferase domain